MAKKPSSKDVQPIIVIKKVKKVEAGHHGGAWKVAYADFVTAMMAFFLLLWLLNVVTDENLAQISTYFDPAHPLLAESVSGAGGLMGGRSMASEGAMITDVQKIDGPRSSGALVKSPNIGEEGQKTDKVASINFDDLEIEELEELLRSSEEKRFAEAQEALQKAIDENEELKGLDENLMIDMTPEGLRIQILDQEGKPMFPIGSAEMFGYTKELMKTVAGVIKTMPNDISIRGHTDSYQYAPNARYTNWELSADRANSSRRVLMNSGVESVRIADVMGKADQDHMFPETPLDPRNRRISIIMLHETIEQAIKRGAFKTDQVQGKDNVVEEGDKSIPYNAFDDYNKSEEKNLKDQSGSKNPLPDDSFKRTPGTVYFP